ncbi:TVP38/TMEM64 family protein [Bacillus sp. FJAT-29790]|uniref:TVP38/TMEM64 family protein n=1 Tax=Bacillus sp. FJAT-29790 TaxID=1895002 RepID=UPI001C215614|nr:TVP38/TMEM64 family protein [Bacillus sp. FJAT-29790]MBU8877406.1 TVP38/TMEM64 family protein [Bacillus sp. FJAT-29790]
MDFELLKDWFTLENIMGLIEKYRTFGPVPGILLPLIEAFLPFLPLFLFVMANANAFGLWLGFLFSWIGAAAGAFIVFLLVRKYGQRRILKVLKRNSKVQKLMNWVERHGFGPLFILLCLPFTPSAVVNIVAGLSKISIAQYMLAVVTGKMVMIFTMSFVGYDIKSLITQPMRTVIVAVIIFILWYVGKRIEIKMNMNVEKEKKFRRAK